MLSFTHCYKVIGIRSSCESTALYMCGSFFRRVLPINLSVELASMFVESLEEQSARRPARFILSVTGF